MARSKATVLATPHVRWPLFEARHSELAARFAGWNPVHLAPHEADEGGDGRAARLIFEALGAMAGCSRPPGVRKGEVVERLHRHVRAFRIFDGTSEIQKLLIARSLLEAGK